jgi:hypothetical protein
MYLQFILKLLTCGEDENDPNDELVEVDTCKAALCFLCNLKLGSNGFVLLAFQSLTVFVYTTRFSP